MLFDVVMRWKNDRKKRNFIKSNSRYNDVYTSYICDVLCKRLNASRPIWIYANSNDDN